MKKGISIQKLAILGVLIAMEIVLSRFVSISTWNMKIGFAFIPVAAAAILLGPVEAAVCGGLADLLGATLFPIGAYFPGFTLTAALTGLEFGLLFHKEQTPLRVVCAVLINQFILGLLCNTYFISVLYGSDFKALFATRIVQSLILTVVQTAGILILAKILQRVKPSLPAMER